MESEEKPYLALKACPLNPMKNHGYQISTRRNLGARKKKDCALISEQHTKREPYALYMAVQHPSVILHALSVQEQLISVVNYIVENNCL